MAGLPSASVATLSRQTRKRRLAVAVFEAALSPGMHEGFLRKEYEQLQKGKWSPDPRR